MTQEEFDKAPLLDQILYDTTGMLVENHQSIAEAMDKYHQSKLKLLGIANVNISALTKILKSDSVYTLLRFGVKSPSESGMDDCDDNDYYDLYQLVCELRKH